MTFLSANMKGEVLARPNRSFTGAKSKTRNKAAMKLVMADSSVEFTVMASSRWRDACPPGLHLLD